LPSNFPTQFSLRKHLIQGAVGSLFFKIVQTCLSLILSIIIARLLEVEGFGNYTFFLSIVNLLSVPAMLGGHNLLVREIATYKANGDFHFMRGLIRRMRQASGMTSVLLTFGSACIGYWIYQESPLRYTYIIAMFIVPLLTMMNLQGAVLRGLRYLLLGQLNMILLPILIAILLGCLFVYQKNMIQLQNVIIIYVLSVFVVVSFSFLLVYQLLPQEVHHIVPAYETNRWVKSLLPFLFTSSMHLLNSEASVLLLGMMKGPETVGLFRVAQRGADLIPFGLHAVNAAIAPTVAELFAKGEKDRLQRIINKSIIAITLFAIPSALILILAGPGLISVAFGKAYVSAYPTMVILSLGQLFNACMGSVGVIMSMIGLERFVARGITIATLINLLFNIILIFFWGITGASIATTASIIIWNILLALWLYRESGLISFFRFSAIYSKKE
jgi:O-antigen/teichoic acid export membrane protein